MPEDHKFYMGLFWQLFRPCMWQFFKYLLLLTLDNRWIAELAWSFLLRFPCVTVVSCYPGRIIGSFMLPGATTGQRCHCHDNHHTMVQAARHHSCDTVRDQKRSNFTWVHMSPKHHSKHTKWPTWQPYLKICPGDSTNNCYLTSSIQKGICIYHCYCVKTFHVFLLIFRSLVNREV